MPPTSSPPRDAIVVEALVLPFLVAALLCSAGDAALDCSFCGEGVAMLSPDRNYSWSTAPMTCADFEKDFGDSFVNDDGQEVCDLEGFWIDMAAYCNCEGHSPSYACDFCASGTIVNPDLQVDAPEESDLLVSLTCEQAGLATEYIADEKNCLALKLLFAPSCCSMSDESPAIESPESSNQTQGSAQCSICPSGSVMLNGNRSLFFIGDGLTCETGEAILAGLDSEDECVAAAARFDRIPLDVASWCGCSGANPPDNGCSLCTQSPGGVVENDDTLVDLGDNFTVTCLEADLLATYISNADVCQSHYPEAVRQCCSGVPTGAPAPTPAPTRPPTFATSSGVPRPLSLSLHPRHGWWGTPLVVAVAVVLSAVAAQ